MSTKACSQLPAKPEPHGFDLADYVRRSAEASHVPLHVEDVGVLANVAAMVKPPNAEKAPRVRRNLHSNLH